MKRNLIAMFVLMAGGLFAQYRDGHAQSGGNNGGGDRYDPRYDDNGSYADSYDVRTPPPDAPRYDRDRGFRRSPMPGPGFIWVDAGWTWMRGHYVWVAGYWTRPPFMGGYWVSSRYDRGRFFSGFWAGNRNRHFDRDREREREYDRHAYRR